MVVGKLIIIPALGHQNNGKSSFTGSGLFVLMSQGGNNNQLAHHHVPCDRLLQKAYYEDIVKLENNAWHYKNRKKLMGNSLIKVSLNIKKCTNVSGRTLRQCKKPIVASWHTPYEKTNGETTSFPGSILYFEVEKGPWERGSLWKCACM